MAQRTVCNSGHKWVEENIYTNPTNGDRMCRKCRYTASAKWKKENSAHHARTQRFRKYQITESDYLTMLVLQDSTCAICKRDFMTNKIHIDHSYSTGEVRGLLCPNCNTGLGKFGDNPALLQSAQDYLAVN